MESLLDCGELDGKRLSLRSAKTDARTTDGFVFFLGKLPGEWKGMAGVREPRAGRVNGSGGEMRAEIVGALAGWRHWQFHF
jgi:hypothetical protein